MKRVSWASLFCLAAATTSLPAVAQPREGGDTSDAAAHADDQHRAQECFQRAKELYLAGNYSQAIVQLEIARDLDPKAKELVMNIGIVHEKLGQYDEAIHDLKTFLEMEGVTAAERTKAEGMIKRLEGAKRSAPPPAPVPVVIPPPAPAPAPPPPPPAKGRVDAFTIAAASTAVVGLGVGAGVGIYALAARPAEGFVTGRDGTYRDLQTRADNAHTAALVADVSLGVGLVASLATAWLYFSRTKDQTPNNNHRTGSSVAIATTPGKTGGVILLGGSFQ